MNSPIQGRRHETTEEFHNAEVGDWAFSSDDVHIFIETPVGLCILQIDPKAFPEYKKPVWTWDGNRDAPTLTPSIRIRDHARGEWHGWMREGKLVSA